MANSTQEEMNSAIGWKLKPAHSWQMSLHLQGEKKKTHMTLLCMLRTFYFQALSEESIPLNLCKMPQEPRLSNALNLGTDPLQAVSKVDYLEISKR